MNTLPLKEEFYFQVFLGKKWRNISKPRKNGHAARTAWLGGEGASVPTATLKTVLNTLDPMVWVRSGSFGRRASSFDSDGRIRWLGYRRVMAEIRLHNPVTGATIMHRPTKGTKNPRDMWMWTVKP